MIIITKSQLKEHIAKLVAEQVKNSKMKDHALLIKLLFVESLHLDKMSKEERFTLSGLIEDGLAERYGRNLYGLTELGGDVARKLQRRGHKPFSVQEQISKLVAEQVKSLSPAAQKALELSRQAKLNKDAQKKRAAAKDSMRGISVESVEPMDEQSSWHRDKNEELTDLYKTKYRVNFGQGQVSNTFPTRKEAEYELTFHDEPNAFIQFKDLDTGEWFDVRHLK